MKNLNKKKFGITYRELQTLLKNYGYEEQNKGKSSGSRVAFVNSKTEHIIRLHKPHPEKELKKYQIDLLYDEFNNRGFFK